MAKVTVCCPSCRTQFQVEENLLGKKARCKLCRTHFILAAAGDAATVLSFPWPWLARTAPDGATAPDSPPNQETPRSADGVPDNWKPGDVVLDLYEVREVFTSGGMGLVYRVRHRGWNLDLAVKCPRPQFFRHEQDKENFEREAETWVKLGLHAHTVACYYVRRLGGIPRVFAEYVGGGSLEEWVRTRKLYAGGPRAALERVLDLAIQFAWGLRHAHEQGLIHRDVKPGNVLLTTSGIAKVTDFGMARAHGGSTETAGGEEIQTQFVTAGGLTPAFCSPEQVRGELVSRKTDIWSWGVSILEMFTGAVTWSAGYLAPAALNAFLHSERHEPYLPPLPAGLVELLRQCFRAEPKDRPEDMQEIALRLQIIYQETLGRPHTREAPLAAEALADSLNNRAVSLLDLKKQDEAEQLWEKALAAHPQHPECVYNLGLSRWRSGRHAGSALVRQLREVCAVHPGEWLPLYLLGQIQLERGDWTEAREALESIAGAGTHLEEVQMALAATQAWLGCSRAPLRTYEGHADWVSSVSLSRGGRYALSGSADGTLKLWDVPTGQCLRTFAGHTEWVTAVSLGSDGRHALSGSADRTLRWWDVATGRCLAELPAHERWVLAVALCPDGRCALSGGGDGALKLWDLGAGAERRHFGGHTGPVTSLAVSADGRLALSGGRDTTVKVWDVDTGECLRIFEGHGDRVLSVSLSGDGGLAVSGGADRTVRLWDVASGQCLHTWEGHAGAVHSVYLGAESHLVLSGGGDRSIRLWCLGSDRCLATLAGHAGTVNSVCLGAGGRHAVSGRGDHTLALWSFPRAVKAPFLVSRVLPSDLALTAWAEYEQTLARAAEAAAAGDAVEAAEWVRAARGQPGYGRRPEALRQWGQLYLRLPRKGFNAGWEGATLEGHLDAVTCVCVSGDGRYALSGSADRTLKHWEVNTGQCLRTLEGHGSALTAVCCTRDGRQALSASADGTLKLWESASGRCLVTFHGHEDAVTSAGLSGDGRLAWSGSADGTQRLWDAKSGRCLYLLDGHGDPVQALAVSDEGSRVISGSAQFLVRNGSERLFTTGQLRLWETASGRCRHTFERAEAVTAVRLSPDGRHAVSGGGRSVFDAGTAKLSQAGTLYRWEMAAGRRLDSYTGHAEAVTSVCFSGDGRYILSGSLDRTVKLWEASGGRCLRTFGGHRDAVTAVAFSPDGRYALSGSVDRLPKVWVLDWELTNREPGDWDEGARPYLETFLTRHTPYTAPLPPGTKRSGREGTHGQRQTSAALTEALTRRGRPIWSEEDFEELLHVLGCAGYGWLRPAGVQRQLERLARARQGPGDSERE